MNLFILIAAVLLLVTEPHSLVTEDRVASVEVNHFCDDRGREVFTQNVFRETHRDEDRIVDWRLVKHASQRPTRDFTRGDFSATWWDGDRLRTVRALSVRETWSTTDPELRERECFAKERRRELLRPIPCEPRPTLADPNIQNFQDAERAGR